MIIGGWMPGKRGENPPLPRSRKRERKPTCHCHG